MNTPIENERVYLWAARDALSMIDMHNPFELTFVSNEGRINDTVRASIHKCVKEKAPEFQYTFLDTGQGHAHEQLVQAYKRLESAVANINAGQQGKSRFYTCVGELVYHAVNMRLPHHIVSMDPKIRWKFTKDMDVHLEDLGFQLDDKPIPISANDTRFVILHAEEYLMGIRGDIYGGYIRGNGYPTNPRPLKVAYDQACNYIYRLLISLL